MGTPDGKPCHVRDPFDSVFVKLQSFMRGDPSKLFTNQMEAYILSFFFRVMSLNIDMGDNSGHWSTSLGDTK